MYTRTHTRDSFFSYIYTLIINAPSTSTRMPFSCWHPRLLSSYTIYKDSFSAHVLIDNQISLPFRQMLVCPNLPQAEIDRQKGEY